MDVTTELIKNLREKIGCGMMDCKAALTEAGGDMEKAIEILRKKGIASTARRAGRVASQGLVDAYVHFSGKIGVLVEVNCESDFVAKNTDFQAFVKDLAMQIAASNPSYVSKDDVPDTVVEHEKEIMEAQTRAEGKPEKAVEKIVEGRLEKFFAEACLLNQPFIRDPKITVNDLLGEIAAKIGENIVIRRFTRYQLGEKS